MRSSFTTTVRRNYRSDKRCTLSLERGIYSAEGGGTINDRCQVQFTSYRCADGALFDS
jgi:hypothetical protein